MKDTLLSSRCLAAIEKEEQVIPVSWVIVPISEVADIGPRSFCFLPVANSLPVHFVPMSAVSEEFRGIDVSSRRPLSEVQKGYTQFLEGDVLFAKITPCMENGKVALVPKLTDHIAFGSTEFHVLRSTEAVISKWLAYFLSQANFRKIARQSMTGSAGQLRVSTQWLSNTQISVAPLTEQFRIIAKLDELFSDLDAGVAELKAAQKKLAQYRQSLLKAAVEGTLTTQWRAERAKREEPLETGAQLLERILMERRRRWEEKQLAKFKEQGKTLPKDWRNKYPEPVKPKTADLPELPEKWVWASLGQLVAESCYGTSVKCDYLSADVPVLRIPNVVGRKLDLSDLKFATQPLGLSPEDYLKVGDILIVRTNGSISLVGRAAVVVLSLTSDHYFASYLLRLRCVLPSILPSWISVYLASYQGRRWIERRAASSAGQHNISLSTLLSMTVPLPPLTEQNEVLAALESQLTVLEDQDRSIELGLKQSAAQRQNILKAAFSGQLVPQDPNDEHARVLLERIRAEREARANESKQRSGRKKVKGVRVK